MISLCVRGGEAARKERGDSETRGTRQGLLNYTYHTVLCTPHQRPCEYVLFIIEVTSLLFYDIDSSPVPADF